MRFISKSFITFNAIHNETIQLIILYKCNILFCFVLSFFSLNLLIIPKYNQRLEYFKWKAQTFKTSFKLNQWYCWLATFPYWMVSMVTSLDNYYFLVLFSTLAHQMLAHFHVRLNLSGQQPMNWIFVML